jgi:uncharacterized protein (TIGR03435 family)
MGNLQNLGSLKRVLFPVSAVLVVSVPIMLGAPQAFDVVSIRPSSPAPAGGRGGAAGGCASDLPKVGPSRFAVANATLYALIVSAYFSNGTPFVCAFVNKFGLISGGPGWIRSDRFTIQALAPAGSPSYTFQQFLDGKAPTLQIMIQNLLADRFRLVLHRGTKEVPVYFLTVAKGGPKLERLEEGSCRRVAPIDPAKPPTSVGQEERPRCGAGSGIFGTASGMTVRWDLSLGEFASIVSQLLDRPVIDKTGITGMVKFNMEFAADQAITGPFGELRPSIPEAAVPSGSSIFTAIQEQVGLKLEAATGPVEVFVIDHVDRPSEN